MEMLYIGADHAGFKLKEKLKPSLESLGCAVRDLSPTYVPGDDYPKIGAAVARRTAKDKARGILVCGSGAGVAIAANRVKGVRAVAGFSAAQVKLAREHNDANVLALAGWNTAPAAAMRMIKTFLRTRASAAKRHRRRIKQLG